MCVFFTNISISPFMTIQYTSIYHLCRRFFVSVNSLRAWMLSAQRSTRVRSHVPPFPGSTPGQTEKFTNNKSLAGSELFFDFKLLRFLNVSCFTVSLQICQISTSLITAGNSGNSLMTGPRDPPVIGAYRTAQCPREEGNARPDVSSKQ